MELLYLVFGKLLIYVKKFKQILEVINEKVYRDYLRELMSMEKNLDPNDEKLKMLAEKAANLVDVPEIDINVTVSF